ncbi:MAG: cupin domain-containing protein [Gaiellaceae bacterium]
MSVDLDIGGVIVPTTGGEPILRREKREITILVAREDVTITHARYAAGEQVAGPHVHHDHTDAFCVLDGELNFEIGREAETVTVSSGGFVVVPPRVAHTFRNDGERPACWLTTHARDGGFAAFMRGAPKRGGRVGHRRGTRQTVGPGTLISVPRDVQLTLGHRGCRRVRMLSLHTPDGGFAD